MRLSRIGGGLRARFLLIVLGGVILPLALTGAWLGRHVRRSGEALVEERLERQLAAAATEIGQRWVGLRSELLSLAEHPTALATLEGAPFDSAALAARWDALSDRVESFTLHDGQGRERLALRRSGNVAPPAGRGLPVRLDVYGRDSGASAGRVVAILRSDWLTAVALATAGSAGAVPTILTVGGDAVLGAGFEPALLAQGRFRALDDDWLARQRRVYEPPLTLALAAPLSPQQPFVQAATRGLLALLLVATLAVGVVLVLTRRIVAPLERLTAAAESVAAGRLDTATPLEGVAEVQRLGRAFAAMTDSLRRLIRRVAQQQAAAAVGEFASALAHEVRNPITAVRLDLERARESASAGLDPGVLIERGIRQLDRLDATVTGALRIARSGNATLAPLDLRVPIAAAIDSALPVFRREGVPLASWQAPSEPLTIAGDASAIEQLLLNLLLNAAGAMNGQGTVRIEAVTTSHYVELAVHDDGCGMSGDEVSRATEPFYTTRPDGTGLGLTIVRRIADAHGAELCIQSTLARGTTVRVRFPRGGLAEHFDA